MIVIPISLGVGSFALRTLAAVDTGCHRTLVSRRVVDRLGLGADRLEGGTSITGVGGPLPAEQYRLDFVAAAGLRRPNASVLTCALPGGLGFECLLGLDFLAGHELCLNLPGGYLDLRAV